MFKRLPVAPIVALSIAIIAAACDEQTAPTAVPRSSPRSLSESEPGTRPSNFAPSVGASPADVSSAQTSVASASMVAGLSALYTETGKLTLSVDGLGTGQASGIIQVEKPAGATVRAAFIAAASTGFSQRSLAPGDVTIDGVGFPWGTSVPSTIFSWNHWADVTTLVKPKIDAAPAGRVDFSITEVATSGIDGEILAVVFDDPSQATNNTVVLLFGAQNVAGDQFVVSLANPLDLSDPSLVLNMSLGISFGFQPGGQFSEVNVNGARLSTSAGGQDDASGPAFNGTLITVGGLDDATTNPSPFAFPSSPRTDDELYDLKPFVANGDASITVTTRNPSNDDNILFAAFFLTVEADIIVNPPPNVAPVANPGGPYTGAEGSPISLDGSASSDADGDALTYAWDFENDGIVDATTATASHTYFDNGAFTARLTVNDGNGGTHSQTVAVTVANVAPSLGALTVPTAPLPLQSGGTPATISGGFTDPGTLDTHTGSLSCDGGTAGTVSATAVNGTGSASGVCTFTAAGVYTVSMTVTDDDGGSDTETATTYIVIYDPSAGFVTGGGWIESPTNAYPEDPTLTGKASFGFVSKYQKGATTPSGNTEFQFHAGSLDFHSDTYQWLVMAGARAQYKGVGSIKGREGSYGFLVTAIDGQVAGGGGTDRFRIKIWNAVTSVVVYDNQPGELEDSGATTALGGGSISIKAK
jgi:PKD repeat protein